MIRIFCFSIHGSPMLYTLYYIRINYCYLINFQYFTKHVIHLSIFIYLFICQMELAMQ
jgi:hypothetical protein